MNFLEFVRHYEYTHIPSALSHIYYLDYVFGSGCVRPYIDNIVLGKPFGHAAYYYVWQKYGMIGRDRGYDGIRHSQIDFVDFSDVTLGNALGVASGLEMGNGKMTYVNLSDSQLQMGSVVEAIQFIGRHKQNIKMTIDYNGKQLTSDLLTTLEADKSLFESNGWWVFEIDEDYRELCMGFRLEGPVVFFVKTKKGDGIPEMEYDLDKWHYRPVGDEELTMTPKLVCL